MSDMRLIVAGAGGRMGRALTRVISEMPGAVITGALEAPGSELLGKDAGVLAGLPANGIKLSADLWSLSGEADGILGTRQDEDDGAVRNTSGCARQHRSAPDLFVTQRAKQLAEPFEATLKQLLERIARRIARRDAGAPRRDDGIHPADVRADDRSHLLRLVAHDRFRVDDVAGVFQQIDDRAPARIG